MPPALALAKMQSLQKESRIESRFASLRGVRWRIYLGILPRSPASIGDLRRVTADSRRRYANLRRRLIVDPHLNKDDNRSFDLVMDNPLSQSPDSIWSRYFQNAELERTLDQDLSRLYPEEGSYFQTATCQTTLRRILLLWCLIHPECGYRQGMHELLAPLLYVLYIDLQCLSNVRGQYEDHFNDEFQGVSLPETDFTSTYRFGKVLNKNLPTDRNSALKEKKGKVRSSDELDRETRDIFLMSDAYGAEGELGIVLSEKFMEHDAYCMFDNLMSDAHGAVTMAAFFSPSHKISSMGSLPIIEASSAIYQLLASVDSSLHSHLVELGVEPQYFSMRWLRVLFGREFSLEDILIIWDEIFSFPNHSCFPGRTNEADHFRCRILGSPRGAFILAMAVSMLLHLRSSLLATDYSTACLRRLLNFPGNTSAVRLIEKAKAMQDLALDIIFSCLFWGGNPRHSPTAPNQLSDSYWEEKWRLLNEAEESTRVSRPASEKAKGPVIERSGLSRRGSEPGSSKFQEMLNGCLCDSQTIKCSSHAVLPISENTAKSLGSGGIEDQNDGNVTGKISDRASNTDLSRENSSAANDHDCDDISFRKEEITRTESEICQGSCGVEKKPANSKQWKRLAGRFPWLRKTNRGSAGHDMGNDISDHSDKNISGVPASDGTVHEKIEDEDNTFTETLTSIACSVLENIEVIESFLKRDQVLKNCSDSTFNPIDGEESQAAAVFAALRELRKISGLLSEM